MTTESFGDTLNKLRKARNLTVQQLADRAGVGQSLISGLQTGHRVVGENNARKIAQALNLSGEDFEEFVYLAINDCTERVLCDFRKYPAEVLNLIADELQSFGITPEVITHCARGTAGTTVYLKDGREASINAEVVYR